MQPLTLSSPSNAFIFPVVYFFYPETAYRSLEEMDVIFQKTTGWKGWFTVVNRAHVEPRRYGKHGEMLIDYEDTEIHHARMANARNVLGGRREKLGSSGVENVRHANPDYVTEKGHFSQGGSSL